MEAIATRLLAIASRVEAVAISYLFLWHCKKNSVGAQFVLALLFDSCAMRVSGTWPEALLLPKDLEEEVGTLAVVVKIRS